MGDRIGVTFCTGQGSTDLYAHAHWAGRSLLVAAQEFQRERAAAGVPPEADLGNAVRAFVAWCYDTDRFDREFNDVEVCDWNDLGEYVDCGDNGVFFVDLESGIVSRAGLKPLPLFGA